MSTPSSPEPLPPQPPTPTATTPATPGDCLTVPPSGRVSRPYCPPDPDDREAEGEEFPWLDQLVHKMGEGDGRNVRILWPKPGQRFQLRFLEFGEGSRPFALYFHHEVFRSTPVACPRGASPPFHEPIKPCAICAAQEAGEFDDWIKPRRFVQIWAYAVILPGYDGDDLVAFDPEGSVQPVRLCLRLPAKAELYCTFLRNPQVASEQDGNDYELTIRRDGSWHLEVLRTGPLQLSADPQARRRQLIELQRQLSDPRPALARPTTAAEQESALRHLRAHRDQPTRYHRRFWSNLMAGSLPRLVPPGPIEREQPRSTFMEQNQERKTATGKRAVENSATTTTVAPTVTPDRTVTSAGPPPPPSRPQIWVPGRNASITETAHRLYAVEATKGELYLNGGRVVAIDRTGGFAKIVPLEAVAAQSRFEKHVDFAKPNLDGDPVPTVLSKDMAAALLVAEARAQLPRLHSVVQWPFPVVRQGQLVSLTPGYNAAEGIYVVESRPVEEMSLEEAVQLILDDLFGEFDFLQDSDRSRVIAGLLTPALVVGRLLTGHPAITAIEANQSQAGKGFIFKIIEAANGETASYLAKRTGGVGSLDESFAAALISGRPLIVFDNLRGTFNSQQLESFITSNQHSARAAYRGHVDIDPTRFSIYLTSNGVDFTEDLANRVSLVRIRKREGHQFRRYHEGYIDRHVAANVPRYLGAIHAVIRAWFAAGCQQTEDTRHTFLSWARPLDWIVQELFRLPPLMDDHTSIRERLARPGLGFIRQLAVGVEVVRRLGQELRASELFNLAEDRQLEIPGVPRGFIDDDGIGARHIGRVLSRAFGDDDRLELDDFIVERNEVQADEITHHAQRFYCFTRRPTAAAPAGIVPHQAGLPTVPVEVDATAPASDSTLSE